MYRNCLSRIIFSNRRFVIVEPCAEGVGCLSSVLAATTYTGNNVDDILGVACDVMFDGKYSIRCSAFDRRA